MSSGKWVLKEMFAMWQERIMLELMNLRFLIMLLLMKTVICELRSVTITSFSLNVKLIPLPNAIMMLIAFELMSLASTNCGFVHSLLSLGTTK